MVRPQRARKVPGRDEFVLLPPEFSEESDEADDSDADPIFDPHEAASSRLESFLRNIPNSKYNVIITIDGKKFTSVCSATNLEVNFLPSIVII